MNLIPKPELRDCLKFSVVRNPYSRAVSTFRHHHPTGSPQQFKEFWKRADSYVGLDHNRIAHLRTQSAYIRNCSGFVALDELLRFESLDNEFESFCRKHSIEAEPLPYIGTPHKTDYRDFYDEESKDIIGAYFLKISMLLDTNSEYQLNQV